MKSMRNGPGPPFGKTVEARDSSAALHDVQTPDAFAILQSIVQALGSARTSEQALRLLYTLLHTHCGVLALALQIVREGTTYYLPYGEMSELPSVAANGHTDGASTQKRTLECALACQFTASARLTFVLSAESTTPLELLSAAAVPLGLLLDQEELVRRVEASNERAQQRISEVSAIYEIGQAIDQIELSGFLQLITNRAALLMDAQACSLMLVNAEAGTLRVEASHGLPEDAHEQEQKIGEGLAGRVAQTEQPMLLLNAARDPRLEGMTLRPDISSSMLVPMKSQDGRVMGVLSIRRRRPAADFTNDDLKLFSVFATQAGMALTNVRLYDDLKRRAGELLKISTLSRALISTLDLDELLARVAEDICQVVGFERCCLFVRDTSRPVYIPRVWRGYPDSIGRNPVKEGEGAVGSVARSKNALTFDARQTPPGPERDRHYLQMKGFARSLGTDAYIASPILTSKNRCIGVVVADNKGRRAALLPEQISLLAAFVSQAGIAIENARLYEEMQENYQNIHRLKNYTDNVLQSLGAGILSTDARGILVRWNRAAEETLRQPHTYFKDALLTDVIGSLSLPESEREHLLNMIQRVVTTGERVHLHKFMVHPKGEEPMALNLMLSRLVENKQERGGVVLIFEDVTQEVRLESELDKMRRLADIGQLAAKMAHEVRNALSPIKGAAQIIRIDLEAQQNSTEWTDIIIAEVDNLSRLTSEMLDFARPKPLDPRPLRIPEFLAMALQSLSPFLGEAQVQIDWDVAADLPEALGDPVQLGQVVRNLVMNAAQAMPNGGTLTLSAKFEAHSNMIVLRFRDHGVGIAPEELERIFRPFVTTKTKGTGLGLPIVQKVVDHHGGRVEVESRIGEGTSFSVFLPLSPPREVVMEEIPLISARPAGPFPDN